ncbi:hypothetical protein [Photobacterium damselae]|uniref:hypothetical protein n=1 Tax=Photobacterium damselae TaxID=38293 RepID=UPI001F206C9D|nr:hypothetical protein [Photobacterium damselae]MCG9706121.1 hypothetical protein [Photobacterium damselae]UKA04336.1 hypothetical protein IHC89_17750 [Photobacterium damselae subsp. damselae]
MMVSKISDVLITEKAKLEWLAYWRYFSSVKHRFCSETNCTAEYDYGVLVKKDGEVRKVFVVPLCKAHTDNLERLEISDDTEIISADLTL